MKWKARLTWHHPLISPFFRKSWLSHTNGHTFLFLSYDSHGHRWPNADCLVSYPGSIMRRRSTSLSRSLHWTTLRSWCSGMPLPCTDLHHCSQCAQHKIWSGGPPLTARPPHHKVAFLEFKLHAAVGTIDWVRPELQWLLIYISGLTIFRTGRTCASYYYRHREDSNATGMTCGNYVKK